MDIRATGVRTASFALAEGLAPTAASSETGGFSDTDDDRDADIDLTQDFGFVREVSGSFLDWQAENSLNGANGPTDNPDGDFESNLMEYALGDTAASGVKSGRGFVVRINTENEVQAVFTRPLPLRPDINYLIEGTTDEPGPGAVWGQIDPPEPLSLPLEGGEQLIYSGLQDLLFFGGAKRAFLRLRVDLDENQDAIPELTTHSPAWGFNLQTMAARSQTLGMPLATEPMLVGTVDAVNGDSLNLATAVGAGDLRTVLQAERSYMVEVLTGEAAGHRWEVDGAVSAAVIALDLGHSRSTAATIPAAVTGAKVAVRPHWRVVDLFPPDRMQSGPNDRTSAKVTFYDVDEQAFEALWLFSNGGNPRWLAVGDTSFTDAGLRVVDVGEGCFVAPGTQPLLLPLTGMVREHPVVQRLKAGVSLRSGVWTGARSPGGLGLTPENGFMGSTGPTTADRLRFWDGDEAAVESYAGYFLLQTPELSQWVRQGDGTAASVNEELLFKPYRAFFLTRSQAEPTWSIPFPALVP